MHDAVDQFVQRDHRTRFSSTRFFTWPPIPATLWPRPTQPGREFPLAQHGPDQHARPGEYPVEFLYREVLSKDHCWRRCRSSWSGCPSGKPRKTSRSGRRLRFCHVTTRAAWCGKSPTTCGPFCRDRRYRPQVSHRPFRGQRQDTFDLLAGRPAAQPVQARHERKIGGHRFHPDRPQIARHQHPGGHREFHASEGCRGHCQKADDLPRFLKERKPIIVTTQQKFAWVLEEIEKNPELKNLRVAFLIDEAHRRRKVRWARPSACPSARRRSRTRTRRR